MIVKFDKEYLSELFYHGKSSDKKHRFQPNVIQNYKQGISSIRINKQYRLEFVVSNDTENELTITVCNILDITNHYK